jgi:chemotaxis protein MotA
VLPCGFLKDFFVRLFSIGLYENDLKNLKIGKMKNTLPPRMVHVILGICMAISIWIILMGIAAVSPPHSAMVRIIQIFGGSQDGYIQMLTYAAFITGFLELLQKEKQLQQQYAGFDWHLLPVDNTSIITTEQLNTINKHITHLETRGETTLLATIVKRACTLFANHSSVNDAILIVESKLSTAKQESEGQLEIVRYLINTISVLGFIGTVIGLSTAIGNSSMAKTDAGMQVITQYLYLAFDTTLVALLLGLILNYRYHGYLERMDTFYAKSKSYVVDNLICRVELSSY